MPLSYALICAVGPSARKSQVRIEPPDEPEVDPEAESADGDAGGYDEAAGSPAGESA